VTRFALVRYEPPRVHIEVECSPGTYVRVLAADVGDRLGCGAYLESLRRTRSGPFTLVEAATVEALEAEAQAGRLAARLIPPVEVLGLPVLRLAPEDARRVAHGGEVPLPRSRFPDGPGTRVAAVDPHGALVAVMELGSDYRVRPLRVLRPE
jgi:tRNA pseudouridine55 synthase